jgi:hypothetical protein
MIHTACRYVCPPTCALPVSHRYPNVHIRYVSAVCRPYKPQRFRGVTAAVLARILLYIPSVGRRWLAGCQPTHTAPAKRLTYERNESGQINHNVGKTCPNVSVRPHVATWVKICLKCTIGRSHKIPAGSYGKDLPMFQVATNQLDPRFVV